jgi:predicted alpha/beta-fold hydrolase
MLQRSLRRAKGNQRQLLVPVSDGDQLVVQVHTPPATQAGTPLVALVHGLGGSADSDYVRASAYGLLREGFAVARIDLRGAGLSGTHSAGMYHAGRTEDLRAALRRLADESATLAPVGFSLGGNLTLKLLGEPLDALPVVAATVSAPLDLRWAPSTWVRSASGRTSGI